MDFGTLVVIVLAGLGGPLLSVAGRRFVPVVIGEILAGVVAGPALLDVVDPTESTVAFLAQVGFAMLMLTVGMHLPLSDGRLRACLRGGALLAVIVAVLAIPAGVLAATVAGGGHAAIYAVLLASGSAAVLLPALEEAGVESSDAMTAMAQVTIADIVTIVSVPIVLQPGRVGHAATASVLIVGSVLVLIATARLVARRAWTQRVRRFSKSRHWALDLRLSLLVLFFLAWIAQESGTSVLIAGFAAGVLVAVLGGPKRLSTQTRGVADGFFVPLYFVVLGAGLDVGGLLRQPSLLALVAVLAMLTVAIRLIAARVVRTRPAAAMAASAQLGVPAAIASLGLTEHVLSASTATAIVAAALISLAVAAIGVERLAA